MLRRMAMGVLVAGVAAQLAGLTADAVLHARDASLAGREGVLSLSNPGHLLFAGGLALTVLGVCALVTSPLYQRRRGTPALAFAFVPAAVMLVLSGGAFTVAARSGELSVHDHAVAAVGETHVQAQAPAAQGAAASSHEHPAVAQAATATTDLSRHQHGPEVNVSWEQLREIDGLLTTAKAESDKFRDVNVARASGYMQVTQVVPGLGAHFINPGLMARGMIDITRPSILLYDHGANGEFELVGVSWTLPKQPGDDTLPASPFGALAAWHYHTNLCFKLGAGAPVVAAGSEAGCGAGGGMLVKQTPWMVHAWLFRTSPEGVFSHQNSTITGRPAVAGRR